MKFNSYIAKRSQDNLRYFITSTTTTIFAAIALLMLARLSILVAFAREPFLEIPLIEKINFFILAIRFDLKVIAIAMAMPLLVTLVTFYLSVYKYIKKAIDIYGYIILFLLFIFSIINFFYFQTYDKSIDTFIFAFTKEDPIAVCKTLLNDYPIIKGLIAVVVTCFIAKYLLKKLFNFLDEIIKFPKTFKRVTIYFIVNILICAFFARGSLGTFPLRQLNAQVTDKSAINYCIPSGVLAFYWAYKWDETTKFIPQYDKFILQFAYLNLGFNVNVAYSDQIFKPLEHRTIKNEFLDTHKPNIVLNVMESMSTHMLSYDDKDKLDLLGSLREHFDEDMVFTNFLSEGNGTSDSLARLLTSVPDLNLSTSSRMNKDYICNIVKIMKKAGYKTVFVTASSASWRNYDNFLKTLGFDEVIERTHVKRDFPDCTQGTWGIDDEYLFKEAYKVLKDNAQSKPVFMMTLSITNHPPYRVPENVEVQKVDVPKSILKRFPYENTKTIFATFRYANDELGKFISSIKNDEELKENTFIAATGDHNLRGIGYGEHPDELVFGHEVPLYIYMPKAYIENTDVSFEKNRKGSHKDIMTTLLNHAVSDFKFHSFGCDLLSSDKCNFPFAFNSEVAIGTDKDYACSLTPYYEGNMLRPTRAFKFTGAPYMIVKPQEDKSLDCTKEHSLHLIQSELYYYQAHD